MRSEIESLVKQADILGHDFGRDRDQHLVDYLIGLLGPVFPIKVIEKVGDYYRGQLAIIENEKLPDLIMEDGLAKVETMDGISVSLKTEYSVTTEDGEAMYEWGASIGAGHLWKQALKFDKGEDIEAVEAAAQELGLSYEKKSEIPWQSLRKVVKDHIEAGGSPTDVPPEAGKVSMFTHAVIKTK